MKKYIFPTLIIASFMLALPVFSQNQAASSTMSLPFIPKPPTFNACIAITRNLTIGSTDGVNRDGQVTALQNMLFGRGYLKVHATGYFGSLTAAAVKQYQAANRVPATGYVGPLTRAKITLCKTDTPDPSGVTITSPKGGEVWNRGSVQKITWTDSKTYIQAPRYDVKVQFDLDCQPNQPCILLYPIPVTIGKNVPLDTFNWSVGSVVNASSTTDVQTITNGKYRVLVCGASSAPAEDVSGCAKSASYITITGTSTNQ
jgi:hypothetical protein